MTKGSEYVVRLLVIGELPEIQVTFFRLLQFHGHIELVRFPAVFVEDADHRKLKRELAKADFIVTSPTRSGVLAPTIWASAKPDAVICTFSQGIDHIRAATLDGQVENVGKMS